VKLDTTTTTMTTFFQKINVPRFIPTEKGCVWKLCEKKRKPNISHNYLILLLLPKRKPT